jgi:hypothetical protein
MSRILTSHAVPLVVLFILREGFASRAFAKRSVLRTEEGNFSNIHIQSIVVSGMDGWIDEQAEQV